MYRNLSLRFILIIVTSLFLQGGYARVVSFKRLFDKISQPAPDQLSLDYLSSYPQFRCIHHDGFDRYSYIPKDNSGKPLAKYSLADAATLGRNAFHNTKEQAYYDLSNANISVGVKDNSIAFNRKTGFKNNRAIKYVNTQRSNYGFGFKRTLSPNTDSKIAFRIKDVDNFYYLRADDTYLELCKVNGGVEKLLWKKRHKGATIFYGIIDDSRLYVYADFHYVKSKRLIAFNESEKCGLYFSGEQRSEIDDFFVYYLDERFDSPLDKLIEQGQLPNPYVALGCEEGGLTKNHSYTNHSKTSVKVSLDYFEDWENHKIGFSRRSEMCPPSDNASSLDSWICSFDVYFPGREDNSEYYHFDYNEELFWQMHTPTNIMLYPNTGLYIRKDVIRFEVLSRSILRNDITDVKSNVDYGLDGKIAILVDQFSDGGELMQLKKGEWHNFTIFTREGYSDTHLPRTIVYVDGKKVIDWFIPNVQNCGIPPTFLQMGLYKWSWATSKLSGSVKKRELFFDNIKYIR